MLTLLVKDRNLLSDFFMSFDVGAHHIITKRYIIKK